MKRFIICILIRRRVSAGKIYGISFDAGGIPVVILRVAAQIGEANENEMCTLGTRIRHHLPIGIQIYENGVAAGNCPTVRPVQ